VRWHQRLLAADRRDQPRRQQRLDLRHHAIGLRRPAVHPQLDRPAGRRTTHRSPAGNRKPRHQRVLHLTVGKRRSRQRRHRPHDTVNQRWGTWPNAGEQWVELTWSSARTLRSAQVYFFDDNGGVRLPNAWRLQHWTGNTFADVNASGPYPTAVNQHNNVSYTPVTTTRLRLVLASASATVGVLEIKAFA
jgi:hypothetical protein